MSIVARDIRYVTGRPDFTLCDLAVHGILGEHRRAFLIRDYYAMDMAAQESAVADAKRALLKALLAMPPNAQVKPR